MKPKSINKEVIQVLEGLLDDARAGKFQAGDLILEEIDRGMESHHTRVIFMCRGRPQYLMWPGSPLTN